MCNKKRRLLSNFLLKWWMWGKIGFAQWANQEVRPSLYLGAEVTSLWGGSPEPGAGPGPSAHPTTCREPCTT